VAEEVTPPIEQFGHIVASPRSSCCRTLKYNESSIDHSACCLPPFARGLSVLLLRRERVDTNTLAEAFRAELDRGMGLADYEVANALHSNAVVHNNTAAQIWWTKARMGWSETI
jgi:hypothetical protein